MSHSARWGLSVGVFFIVSTCFYFLNVTPWLFFAGIFYLAWEAFRLRWSNSLAVSGAILGLLFIFSIWQYVSPHTGIQLELSNFLLLSLLGVICVVLILLNFPARPISNVRDSKLFLPVIVISAVTAGFVAWFQFSSVPHVSFAMNGDAVWNTVTARFVIGDGGIVPFSHPNPAPLTAELLASVDAPGRNLVSINDLLLHDVVRQSQLWFILLGATSILIMILVSMALKGAIKNLSRFIFFLSALIPYSWFFSGFAFFFGFYNATIAILVMLACWHAWLHAITSPLFSLTLLSAGSAVLLATWAPLVVIPGALMIALVIRQGAKYWFAQTRLRAFAAVSVCLIPLVYFAFFSLADLRREGPALAVDGGIFELSPFLLPALTLFIAVFSILKWKTKFSQQVIWGTAAVVGGASLALGYLLWQRKDVNQLWGYYPVKFSWLVATLLIVILLTTLLRLPDFSQKTGVKSSLTLLLIGSAIGAFMLFARPLGVTEIFSPAAIIFSKGVGANDAVLPEISELASQQGVVVAVAYGQSHQQDLFMNNWLLQLPVNRPDSLQRWYSYYLDGTDLELVCKASVELKQAITVVTKDESLSNKLEGICNNSDISVKVVQR